MLAKVGIYSKCRFGAKLELCDLFVLRIGHYICVILKTNF